ncbi:hypothetical protein G7Y79_00003g011350 [Physcia stellaris]|nr:hypothetical protein G7Y79_00003g011350 [Physcia stellaris]
MKITVILQAVGLASMLGSQGMASPATTDGKAVGLTERTALLEAAKEAAELEKRRYVPIIQGIDGVYQYSSEQLAAQLVGAATSLQQLKDGCTYAPAFTKRLATQHINTTTITDTICAAAKMPALSTNEDVLNKTAEARTRVWIVTALPACGYNFNKLCNLIDIDGANSVGLDGAFVKNEICGVGG